MVGVSSPATMRSNVDFPQPDGPRIVTKSLWLNRTWTRFSRARMCGYFDGAASRVMFRRNSNDFLGLLLCSRVREDVAHITQLCVSHEERGHGLGRLLIENCAANLKSQGFRALTLTVTAANENAVTLYRHTNFQTTHEFDAMLWEKKGRNSSRR